MDKRQERKPNELVKEGIRENKKVENILHLNTTPQGHFVVSRPEVKDGLALVDQKMHVEPVLKKSETAQVTEVVAATKKVLEEGQWKVMEKNIADALTQVEKEKLKEKYYSELDKVNWQKLENKLRLSYNQINWNKVNAQLNTAITNITLDSLNCVYNLALTDLDKAQTWMSENEVESIPDTDLKLEEVKVQKEQVENQLRTIKAIKEKKIIHL